MKQYAPSSGVERASFWCSILRACQLFPPPESAAQSYHQRLPFALASRAELRGSDSVGDGGDWAGALDGGFRASDADDDDAGAAREGGDSEAGEIARAAPRRASSGGGSERGSRHSLVRFDTSPQMTVTRSC